MARSISIATGRRYRDVYSDLGERALKTPRNGVAIEHPTAYLAELGWQRQEGLRRAFTAENLPKGTVICHLAKRSERGQHFCAVIDHVVHDTWNPEDDDCYLLVHYWQAPVESDASAALMPNARPTSQSEERTQQEFEKVLRRLRALDNTANNAASTEGEKRNAIRMMQNLMLQHDLSQEDLVDQQAEQGTLYCRRACPVNGRRVCTWEVMLAWYVTGQVFPAVQFYRAKVANRSMFWFYGPVQDVENVIALFRELLLTIASAARLQYGGYARGSGASYAEGYVAGLPKIFEDESVVQPSTQAGETSGLVRMQERALVVKLNARRWLAEECGVRLSTGSGRGRYAHDAGAESKGRRDGANQQIRSHGHRKRITGS